MKRLLIAILAVALLGTSMLWAQAGFRGYVKRYDNQQPVQGAIVIFVGQTTGHMDSTLTNKNGYYEENDLPLDTYDLTAKKMIGKVWWTDTETAVLTGGWKEVDFFLHPGIEP